MISWRLASFILILSLSLAGIGHAQGPTVEVADSSGAIFSLADVRILGDWHIAGRRDNASVALSAQDLISLKFTDKRAPAAPRGPHVVFPTGEVLAGEVVVSNVDDLKITSELIGEANIPITCVAGFVLDAAKDQAVADLAMRIRRGDRRTDQVLLKNGDVVAGTFELIDADSVRIERNGKSVTLARELVAAVALDPSLLDYKVGSEFFGLLRLTDGSVLHVAKLETQENRVKIQARFGASVIADATELVDVQFRNGRVVYLSDLEPAEAEAKPFLDNPMPHRRDRCVLGGPLQVKGRIYTKGLGVRSYSKLSYELSGFDRFEALVGLDDAAGPQACVRFRVVIDGKPAFDSGEMVSSSDPKPVKLSVKGARRLDLVVDFALRGDVQDFADWCDARLIRSTQ